MVVIETMVPNAAARDPQSSRACLGLEPCGGLDPFANPQSLIERRHQSRGGAPSTCLARERSTQSPMAQTTRLASVDARRHQHPPRIDGTAEVGQQSRQSSRIDMPEARRIGSRPCLSTAVRLLVPLAVVATGILAGADCCERSTCRRPRGGTLEA